MTIALSVERTRPYVLVLGKVEDQELKEYLESLGTGITFVASARHARQKDFDFIIDLGSKSGKAGPGIDGNATVLRFESRHAIGQIAEIGPDRSPFDAGRDYRIMRQLGARASEFTVASNPSDSLDFKSLIRDTILPNITRGGSYTTVRVFGPGKDFQIWPMLQETKGQALGAIVCFPDAKSYWSLPPETQDRRRWVKFFFEVMKVQQPEAFPPDQVGLIDDWRTNAELTALQLVRDHKYETERLLAERNEQLEHLEADHELAADVADSGARLLLTTQGEILTQRVAEVLHKFGFVVEDRDDYALENDSNKQEDLRINHPVVGPTDWTCLIEVKGFTKGAKVNVLQQLSKAAGIYLGANKRPASALWYVVNHHLNEPPQTRPEPLVSNPEEVHAFAAEGGLVLDTRWLFQLEKQLETEQITTDEAAEALMNQTGMFSMSAEK